MVHESWLQLSYKVPSDPATKRVALWRKIKGLGAVYVQNGVCLLPKTDEHLRRLKMLEIDVTEMGGEALILEMVATDQGQKDKVIERFRADRDEHYHEFLERCQGFEAEITKEVAAEKFTYAELEENDADLIKLQSWLEKIKALDFYGASLASQAEQRLKACDVLFDSFSKQVFDAHEQLRGRKISPPDQADL